MTLPQDLVEGESGGRKVSRYANQANLTHSILIRSNKSSTVYDMTYVFSMDTVSVFQNPTLSFVKPREHRGEEISNAIPKRKRKKKGTPPSIKAFSTYDRR